MSCRAIAARFWSFSVVISGVELCAQCFPICEDYSGYVISSKRYIGAAVLCG
jgi:hypothetical protein